MAVRGVDPSEEKKSYGTVFFLGVILLIVASLWVLLDDSFTRRVWKIYQAEFSRVDYGRAKKGLEEEEKRLEADPKYQELVAKRDAELKSIESGEKAIRLAELEELQPQVVVEFNDADQEVKFIKSELEGAWYEYDHAIQQGRDAAPYKRHIDELEKIKASMEPDLEAARKRRADVAAEIQEIKGGVRKINDEIYNLEGTKRNLERQMDNATTAVGPGGLPLFDFTIYKIPKIQQVVLKDFDRNNFDQMVDRVDRCTSCHVAINRVGFDDLPNPLKTHPKRKLFLSDRAHPTNVYGCTTCHDGQGPAINSVAQAHGTVNYWETPLHDGEMVQASCTTCHLNVHGLEGAATVGRGQQIFEQAGCTGCHLVQGYDDIAKIGPSLRNAQAKLDPSWMVRWIMNPRNFRPHTRMPYFYFKEDEALAAASYVWSVSKKGADAWLEDHPLPPDYRAGDPALVEKGEELAKSIGCHGCHGLAEGEYTTRVAGKDIVPNLKDIAAKTNPRWIYNWLLNPKSYNPNTNMPSLRLSEEEALALTTYLMTLGKREAPIEGITAKFNDPKNIKEGEGLVRKYGCPGCHDIPGMETEARIGVELTTFGSKPLEELFFGNQTQIPRSWGAWTFNKIHNPRIYATERVEQLMPHFDLPNEDIEALKILLQGFVERKVPEFYQADHSEKAKHISEGRRIVQQYNCVGCHIINGEGGYIRKYYEKTPTLAPPILTGEGERVQANWLFGFLQNPERSIRPWLKIRMPTFGFNAAKADAIANYFDALSNVEVPYVYFDPERVPKDYLAAGQKLFSNDYFECGKCHQRGENKPEGPVEDWAPDLNNAHVRLNPAWIEKWIRDPQKLQPGTKMPAFYPGGPEDIFGGDESKQIKALTDYIMSLGLEPAVAKAKAEEPKQQSQRGVENTNNEG